MALKNIERPDSEWSYCLDRLFDPEELYYTPMDELIKRYKKRNLIPGRMFNLAKKYGNVPDKRTRIIQAPQMERAGQRIFGTENFYYPPPKVFFCTKPKEQAKEHSVCSSSEDENEENFNYTDWISKRKNLRSGLNKLDLNSEYLKNKKNLTEVEKRVLHSMIHVDKQIQTDPIKEKSIKKKAVKDEHVYHTPMAMKNIEDFLETNKWRLVDLFKDLDKNKDWSINKDDFLRECKKGKLDLPSEMIDELVKILNSEKTEKIFYKELAKGRNSHLSDRRSELKASSFQSEGNSLNSTRTTGDKKESTKSRSSFQSYDTSKTDAKDESYKIDSRLSSYVILPKIDSSMGFYQPPSNEIKQTERSVSVASSHSLVKRSNSEASNKNELSDTKNFIEQLRHKDIKEYIKCLEKTKSLNISNSSLLNGLVAPSDQTSQELIRILKSKTDQKKFLIKEAEKEAKLRNRRQKLINQTNSELDPIGSNSSLANSFQCNLEHSRPVNTSKNVRFIGIDLTERADKPPDRGTFSITRPATGSHLLCRNSAKKNTSLPMKQINLYSKPEDSITFIYQQNQAHNLNKNKNHVFYYQQQQAQQLNKGLRITSASIENRLVKSSSATKKNLNENSNKQSATSVTPIRTPILISNLLASANTLSANSHDKNQNTSYYYYFNRSNTSNKNNGILSASGQSSSKSPANKLKLKELSNLERIGSSNDQGSIMSPRSFSDQKLSNILPINTKSSTPSLDESNQKNSSSTLTLYAYLLQSNKKFPKDVRASIIRSQTKQLNSNRDEIKLDLKSKLMDDSSKRFRLKKDSQSDQFIKLSSRVSSASANTQLSNEENSLMHNSVPLTDQEIALLKS